MGKYFKLNFSTYTSNSMHILQTWNYTSDVVNHMKQFPNVYILFVMSVHSQNYSFVKLSHLKMALYHILPCTICITVSKTEKMYEFGVRYCDRITEQIGNRLKH